MRAARAGRPSGAADGTGGCRVRAGQRAAGRLRGRRCPTAPGPPLAWGVPCPGAASCLGCSLGVGFCLRCSPGAGAAACLGLAATGPPLAWGVPCPGGASCPGCSPGVGSCLRCSPGAGAAACLGLTATGPPLAWGVPCPGAAPCLGCSLLAPGSSLARGVPPRHRHPPLPEAGPPSGTEAGPPSGTEAGPPSGTGAVPWVPVTTSAAHRDARDRAARVPPLGGDAVATVAVSRRSRRTPPAGRARGGRTGRSVRRSAPSPAPSGCSHRRAAAAAGGRASAAVRSPSSGPGGFR